MRRDPLTTPHLVNVTVLRAAQAAGDPEPGRGRAFVGCGAGPEGPGVPRQNLVHPLHCPIELL